MTSSSNPIRPYTALLKRDLLLAVHNPGQLISPLMFYILVIILFPFGIKPDPNILSLIAPGVIWVAALLATLLAMDSLFRADYLDGSLEQLTTSSQSLALLVTMKILVHWLITGLPLVILAPLLGVLFSLSIESIGILIVTLLLGTPVLSLIGAMGAALTLNARNSNALLALIILPFYIPVLIFGAGTVNAAAVGLPVTGQLYLLAALLVSALTLSPVVAAAAIKISLN